MGMVNVIMEPEAQDISNYIIYQLKRLEISVTVSPKNFESRKVTAEFEVPEAQPVRIAVPVVPGAGPQPPNTLVLLNVQDQIQTMIKQLEQAVQEVIQQQGDF